MTRAWLLVAVIAAGAQVGCSSARYVQRGADEGVVAIPDRSNDWPTFHQDKAAKLIAEHVGPDYEVVEEWSEKVGENVHHDQKTNREPTLNSEVPFILPAEKVTTQTTTTTSDVTEWRIKYRKKAPGAPAAGPVVPAGR